ncbi:serine hydrolase [Paenibacillus barengoltzii]|uniref:serine hydrolase domain-containing protein n=1 Tax=Paenibacillus barengoltzii TaxID=343517 RepID=UPI002FD8B723
MNVSSISAAIAPLDLRSCLIHTQGRMVLEHYRNDQIADELAKINSCTKSFLSALLCIAWDQGLLPSPDTPIRRFFPQLEKDPDERKREITLRHLLTMTAGWNWTEFGGHNSFPRMTRSPNWVQFALEQPMADRPGDRMEYNSGASQLLSAILVQVTGIPVAQFAEEHLFGPLGIETYRWQQDPQGIHTGGFGMWLRPQDMLKFGLLYLQGGKWEGQQVIQAELVAESVMPAIDVESPWRGCYAWHWWVDVYGEDGHPRFDFFYARGYGGQFIYVIPSLETVVVLTQDQRKQKRPPTEMFRLCIAPYLV